MWRFIKELILLNNQQMQLFAVNFIPLLGSLYMFRAFYTPIIRSTILTVTTVSGTNHTVRYKENFIKEVDNIVKMPLVIIL